MGDLILCGLPAVRARFQRDADSIRRLYFDYATGRKIGMMCQALARARRIYRCVEPAELEKIAGTVHHGGIVAVVKAERPAAPTASEVSAWAKRRQSIVILDRVGNAHNLGAIARTAAFFGVPVLVLTDDSTSARPNDAAHRVAEGGFEHLEVRGVADLPAFLRDLAAAGYEVVGAAARGASPPPRQAKGKPTVSGVARTKAVALVLGNEEHGLAPEVAACTRLVTIPGSGKIESLNVSVAAGVLMRELFF